MKTQIYTALAVKGLKHKNECSKNKDFCVVDTMYFQATYFKQT